MNFNKVIYIASKDSTSTEDDYSNEIVTYQKPLEYSFNVQPLSGYTATLEFGIMVSQMQRAVIDYTKYFGAFKVGDLAYLDGVTPTGETKNGKNANYRIYSISNQNKRIVILFESLVGRKV